MFKFIVVRVVLLLISLALVACGAFEGVPSATLNAEKAFVTPDKPKRISEASAVEAFSEQTKNPQDYTLYDGDDISIEVFGRPELSGAQRIGPDGRITLPVVGTILLRNMTRDEAATAINKALSLYYVNILTTVRVNNYNSNRITMRCNLLRHLRY